MPDFSPGRYMKEAAQHAWAASFMESENKKFYAGSGT